MTNLEHMLQLVRDGRIDFGQFVARTRREYHSMAMYLMRRWTTPSWFIVEDVEQELYLETWRRIWGHAGQDGSHIDFDDTRGVSLQGYVVYNAMTSAKRAMHKARGVTISGNPDRKASQFERPLSQLGSEEGDGEAMMMAVLAEFPKAEEEIAYVQQLRRTATRALKECKTSKERTAVLAIREAGSLDKAGHLLYDDVGHRVALRLGSEEKANKFVVKHAAAVARRMHDTGITQG